MTNKQISDYFSKIYNGWFRKWRDCEFQSQQEWDDCVSEYDSIRKENISDDKDMALVNGLANVLLEEIDRRWREQKCQ